MTVQFDATAIYQLDRDHKFDPNHLKKGTICCTDKELNWYRYIGPGIAEDLTDSIYWPDKNASGRILLFRDYWRFIEPREDSPYGQDLRNMPKTRIV